MAEEVIKEAMTSTPASAELKKQDLPINTTAITDGNSVPPYLRRKEKPVPHYQRPSTGSCHDNCKLDIHHSSESKKCSPVRGWRQDRANSRNGTHDLPVVIPQGDKARNKSQTLKISHVKDGAAPAKPVLTKQNPPLKGVPDLPESAPCVQLLSDEASETVVARNQQTSAKCLVILLDDLSSCGDGQLSERAVSIELDMPLAIQDSDQSDDHSTDHSANESVSSEKMSKQTVMAPEKDVTKSQSFSQEAVKTNRKATSSITKSTMSKQKREITSHQKAAGTSAGSANRPRTTAENGDPSATSTNKFSRERKPNSIVASTLPRVKKVKAPSPASVMDSSAKPATNKHAPSPSPPSGKQNERKITLNNVVRNAQLRQNKGEEKVTLSPLKLSRSTMRAVRKETCASPVKIKKVYAIESSSECKDKISKTALQKIRKPDVSNKERQSRKEHEAIAKHESAGRPKIASTPSGVIMKSPRMLKFHRGKVLNLGSNSDNSTPRRVQFRPADATAEGNRSKYPARRRTTKNNEGKASAASKDSGASRAEVVVLRRQDANDKKKSEPRLFNNVIKETASRLVEARKSKVKALVGAFETVISLQGKKQGRPSIS
ncbi:uncharacterized protein LOC123398865 [Hordeum vulgare subsp. vulgare]|uniref:Predicted protein n=1 Tax=Hordeum vulgare subsp. vulgare TaxID=112509 RepID=F2CZR9_HORVV|nr:uncharacterized protein LOC123398865 [Hordeum vulgare subsp. vulgare]XP_044949246.1 uncharacterized protein LOC123398865 [Hordeum vulgare subsp. vulgare]BAJ88340.1 predicted protein [Hordeum vulgare subsp. vulgare]